MAYRPGMTVYTGNTIEIPGMGPNYTLKWKFTCNSKTYEDTIATGQSADTYKWRIPSSTFTPVSYTHLVISNVTGIVNWQ